MYELQQKGRWIYITPEPKYDLKRKIIAELSYTKKNAEFMPNPHWGIVRLYQEKRNRFPVGLLNRVENLFNEAGEQYKVDLNLFDINFYVANLTKYYDELRPYQCEATINIFKNLGGILSMPTGSGKTRTSIAIINAIHVPTLIIVPTLDLKMQWEKQVNLNFCRVCTYQGLKSKDFIRQFKLVIFDECHIVAASTLQKIGLNLNEEAITIGLSATPMMRDEDNLKVEAVLGQIVYEIKIRQLIDEGFLVDADIFYHKYDDDHYDETFSDYPMIYNECVVNNTFRNNKIVELAKSSSNYTLILVDRIEHGKILFDMLNDQDRVFLHGKVKDRSDIEHRIIIATSIFDLGVDIPHLQTLILAGGGKSTIKCIQRMGRVLRLCDGKEKAIIHDFIDTQKYLKDHYRERFNIFSENFNPVLLTK